MLALWILGAAVAGTALWSDFDHDEVEHAHLSWAVGRGILPYRDLPQNHVPGLWILAAPLFDAGRNAVDALTLGRLACLAAWAGILVLGIGLNHETVDRPPLAMSLTLAALMLGVGIPWEAYRFRPDPFASLGGSLSLLLAARMHRCPWRYALASGVALGLAASLSFKVLPLVLLVPALAVGLWFQKRSPVPVAMVLAHVVGLSVAALPLLLWIENRGLRESFWAGALAHNSGLLNLAPLSIGVLLLDPVVWLGLVGAIALFRSRSEDGGRALDPAVCLVVGAGLTLSIGVLAPNHRPYNLQAFALPGACLAAVGTAHLLAPIRSRSVRVAALVFVLAAVGHAPLQQVATAALPGMTIGRTELAELSDLARAGRTSCVAFAPAHPVFCKDASRLYLTWDLFFASLGCFSQERRELSRRDWNDAVARIESEKPDLIVNPGLFECAWERGVLGDAQIARFRKLVATEYPHARTLGGGCEIVGDTRRTVRVHVRKGRER